MKKIYVLMIYLLVFITILTIVVTTQYKTTIHKFQDYSYLLGQSGGFHGCKFIRENDYTYLCHTKDYYYFLNIQGKITYVWYVYKGDSLVGDLINAWGEPLMVQSRLAGMKTLYWKNKAIHVSTKYKFTPHNHILTVVFSTQNYEYPRWDGFKK